MSEDYLTQAKLQELFNQFDISRQRLLYGEWRVSTEQERKLRELAETYHTGCEAYDKRVCSGTSPRTGEAMPMDNDEMRLINRHALQMRDAMIAEGERLGFTRRQVEEAIRE